jgi:hypothetical protein
MFSNSNNFNKNALLKYNKILPRSKSLISLAAWMPSSLRFFSISLERATAALSSADMAQPIFGKLQSFKRDNVAAAMFLDSGGG